MSGQAEIATTAITDQVETATAVILGQTETAMIDLPDLAGAVTKLVAMSPLMRAAPPAPALIDGGSMLTPDRADTATELVMRSLLAPLDPLVPTTNDRIVKQIQIIAKPDRAANAITLTAVKHLVAVDRLAESATRLMSVEGPQGTRALRTEMRVGARQGMRAPRTGTDQGAVGAIDAFGEQ